MDEDDTMWVEMPLHKDCKIILHPEEDGTGKFEINEISGQFGLVRILRYDEKAPVKDELWTLSASAADPEEIEKTYGLTMGTSAVYQLKDFEGSQCAPDMETTGTEIEADIFRIRVYSDNTGFRWTEGGGIGFTGDCEQAEAYPTEGCQFAGWYEGDELVSEEPVYRFRVTGDRTLETWFEMYSGG